MDFIRGIPARVFHPHDVVRARQRAGERPGHGDARKFRQQRRRILRHDEVAARRDARARREAEPRAAADFPAGQRHRRTAAVVEFDPLLGLRDGARGQIGRVVFVHDFVHDDGRVERESVCAAGRRRIWREPASARIARLRFHARERRVGHAGAAGCEEEKFVARRRVKAERRLIEREQPARRERRARAERVVSRAARCGDGVARERERAGAAVAEFEEKDRVRRGGEFVESERVRRRRLRRLDHVERRDEVGVRIADARLMQLDGEHIVARRERRGGHFDHATELRIHDVARRERGLHRRARGHVHAMDFRAVEIENRAIIHDVVQQQPVGRSRAAGIGDMPAEVGGDRVGGQRGVREQRRGGGVPLQSQRAGIRRRARVGPHEIERVRARIERPRNRQRPEVRAEAARRDAAARAVEQHVVEAVVHGGVKFQTRRARVVAGQVERGAIRERARGHRVRAVAAEADPLRNPVRREPRRMRDHGERGEAGAGVRVMRVGLPRAEQCAVGRDAGVVERRDGCDVRHRRRRDRAFLVKFHLAQADRLAEVAVVTRDVQPHLPHVLPVDLEMLPRLGGKARRFDERERAQRSEHAARGRRHEHLDLPRAARGEVDLVVIPNVQRGEMHRAAEIVGDDRGQGIRRRGDGAVAQPHRPVRRGAVKARVEPGAVDRVHRAARVAAGRELRGNARDGHAGRFDFRGDARRDFVAEGVVVPRRARRVGQKVEGHRAIAERLVVILHEQSVFGVGRIFIHRELHAAVRRRDPHDPLPWPAVADDIKRRDVGRARREPREREARGAVGQRRAIEKIFAQLPAARARREIRRVVGERVWRTLQAPRRTAQHVRARRVKGHTVDRAERAGPVQADFVRVAFRRGNARVRVARPRQHIPHAARRLHRRVLVKRDAAVIETRLPAAPARLRVSQRLPRRVGRRAGVVVFPSAREIDHPHRHRPRRRRKIHRARRATGLAAGRPARRRARREKRVALGQRNPAAVRRHRPVAVIGVSQRVHRAPAVIHEADGVAAVRQHARERPQRARD